MQRSLVSLLLASLLLLVACGGDDDEEQPAPARTATATPAAAAAPAAADATVDVRLEEEDRSGISGSATLKGGERGFTLTLAVSRRHSGPAHIHNVTCEEYRAIDGFEAQLATVEEPLSEVADGKSRTRVDKALSRYRTDGSSINVHSEEGGFPVVACGDIPAG